MILRRWWCKTVAIWKHNIFRRISTFLLFLIWLNLIPKTNKQGRRLTARKALWRFFRHPVSWRKNTTFAGLVGLIRLLRNIWWSQRFGLVRLWLVHRRLLQNRFLPLIVLLQHRLKHRVVLRQLPHVFALFLFETFILFLRWTDRLLLRLTTMQLNNRMLHGLSF